MNSSMKSEERIASQSPARRANLELLKWEGPQDAREMARRLDVSPMAVRQHLYALAEQKLVTSTKDPRPMGRPAKLWGLTPAANVMFPNAHADLTLSLLRSVRETFGEPGMGRLIATRSKEQIEAYRAEVPRTGSLRRRLEALAKLRTREGYMAEVKEDPVGNLLLVENHCPICAAATMCQNLCAAELSVFSAVLGKDVRVERTDHILAGARRCAYRVTPK
jgi:predicted ArsR family transcriptional regulator